MVVKSKTVDNLIVDLEETFTNLKRYRWKLNPSKCIFISLTHVGRFMLVMAETLSGVGFDATCVDDVAQEYTGWNSNDAL